MTRYKNLNRNSSIAGYVIAPNHIDILFNDNSLYRYDHGVTGQLHVETMKSLAERGWGLCSYIQRFVKKKYAGKSKYLSV
jgi:hypothetical protein